MASPPSAASLSVSSSPTSAPLAVSSATAVPSATAEVNKTEVNQAEVSATSALTLDWPERRESIKAGALGAIAPGLLAIGYSCGHAYLAGQVPGAPDLWPVGALPQLLPWVARAAAQPQICFAELAIALVSGFLFGLTYRYIIRQDRNHHLKAGAVGAFGLVRGLAQVETGLDRAPLALWVAGLWVAEAMLMFLVARLLLDLAFAQGWVRRFGAQR